MARSSRWKKNPVDKNGQPIDLNWPKSDWVNGVQREPHVYPFAGEEHRYSGESGSRGDNIPALERAVGSWTEDDVRRAMASIAYQQPGSVEHELVLAKVQAWFKRAYGDGPARVDATGRLITDGGPIRPASVNAGGGLVHVAARAREGGKVAVSAYDRSPPSG